MIRLAVEPELRRGGKRLPKKPSRFRGHLPLAANDIVDPLDGNGEVLGGGN